MTGRHTILLFAGCLILFLWGTWQLPFLGPDEPRYAQVAREMFETGDYFVPRLGGFAWFEKPVLLYWLISLAYAAFGVNEFAARLPSVLVATGTIAFLHFTIRRIAGKTKALLASAVLASTTFFIGFSHAATFDMLLAFCVNGALCCYLLHEHFPQKTLWLYLMYAFIGSGVLAKGFVAIIIIALTMLVYFIITRRLKNLFALKPVQGALITAGVIAIWFVPVSLIYGVRFWDEFVYQHHFVRYTSSYYHRSQGFFFYLPVLLAGTYPWSFAPFSAKLNGDSDLVKFALCWLFCPVIFFSFSQSKLPGYILPAIPGFAILGGLALSNLQKPLKLVLLSFLLQIVLIGAFFWGAKKYSVPLQPLFVMMGIIAFLSVLSAFLLIQKKRTAAWILYVLILFSAMILFQYVIYPQLPWSDSKMLSIEWSHQTEKNRKLVPYNVYDFSPLFYTNGRMELTPQGYPLNLTSASQLHRYMMQQGEAHVFAESEELQWMERADFWRIGPVLQGKEKAIIELHPK
ncbi:glycosyltransferase family 39 protein [bacterium]|nr:glycosyltransferase family 39 protein [bacterium]